MIDITAHVTEAIEASKVRDGSVLLHVMHSTCAITTMEFEPGAVADLRDWLAVHIPANPLYRHNILNNDTNAHSHLRAALVGASVTIPIESGVLGLGTWQIPVLIDFDDRPRRRSLIVQVGGA